MSHKREDNSIRPRSCIRQPAWKVAAAAAASMLSLTATQGWAQPMAGTLDVHCNEGASDGSATPQVALQDHTYEPQSCFWRQTPYASLPSTLSYLLFVSD